MSADEQNYKDSEEPLERKHLRYDEMERDCFIGYSYMLLQRYKEEIDKSDTQWKIHLEYKLENI